MADIVVLGGAHIDRRGRISGTTASGASNPGQWKEEAGGGAFNAARALARLGHDVTMISPRGGDAEADAVAAAARAAGVNDMPFTFLDRRTPTYTAILERDGNLVIALADMDLYRAFAPRRLDVRSVRERLTGARFVITDANLPQETLEKLVGKTKANETPLAAIAISPAKVVRMRPILPALDFLFMNEAEARALSDEEPADFRQWPGILRALGLRGGAITRGREAAIAWHGDDVACLVPPELATLGDVTGAGDGFAAGFIDAHLEGEALSGCLRRAAASARLALISEMATAETLSRFLLSEALALVPDAEIVL